MGIDSIRGRPPVSPSVADEAGARGATEAQPVGPARSFRADAVPALAGQAPALAGQAGPARGAGVEPAGPSILAQFRSGQIDVSRYLDLKVEEATAHLRALPPEQLASIRSTLRDRLINDPALADLVQAATGRLVPPDDG